MLFFLKFFLNKIYAWFVLRVISVAKWDWLVGLFHKGKYWSLTPEDWGKIHLLLRDDYCVVLTRRKTHLTTYLISIANLLKTGKFGYWSHALLNVEESVKDVEDFKLVEATGSGVHYSKFNEVFDCDSVCLLKPKGFTSEDWTETFDDVLKNLGKPYDVFFNIYDEGKLSCVELVRNALMSADDYSKNFSDFENMIKKTKNLTPDMFYNCKDFEVILEIRR